MHIDIWTYRGLQSLIQRWQLFQHGRAKSALKQMGIESLLCSIFLYFFPFLWELYIEIDSVEEMGWGNSSHGTLGTKQGRITWLPRTSCSSDTEVKRRPLRRKWSTIHPRGFINYWHTIVMLVIYINTSLITVWLRAKNNKPRKMLPTCIIVLAILGYPCVPLSV